MRLVRDDSWKRQGFTLLWGNDALSSLPGRKNAWTIRQLFLASRAWPSDATGGGVLVIGLDGVLDALSPEDGESWLHEDLRRVLLSFQNEYEGQHALILWLPEGRSRIRMGPATEMYEWECGAPYRGRTLPLGRLLWSGAEADVGRVLSPHATNQDADGPGWIGLHIRRVS